MPDTIVSLKGVNKWFDQDHIVKDLNLDIYQGEFLTLLGPSGCGKTTTLRMISGFEFPSSGTITIEGKNVENLEPYQRDVNTVFQNYVLFPNLNVYGNVAYGLKVRRVPKDEIDRRVKEMLKLVRLEGFEKRRISQMSGGQKQRVAIARALINNPRVLLLDEPLSALDLQLRKQMQIELKRLQRKLGITFVYVTHDQEEALTMSDRIGVIHDGVLEQLSTPEVLYDHPATRFVAGFIGESNILDGTVLKETDQGAEATSVKTDAGELVADPTGRHFEAGEHVTVSVRPENTRYSLEPIDGFSIEGTIRDRTYTGNLVRLFITLDNSQEIKITRLPRHDLPKDGSRIYLYWEPDKAEIIKETEPSGKRGETGR
ncbi:MAG: ABC transporter ATP-binding protein [Eubacterium sp.]|nr:ABC transporter ATP-binding protein [Eubacterium sp.]